jgi:spore germination cell wall hydrolase CwlJ-like protein
LININQKERATKISLTSTSVTTDVAQLVDSDMRRFPLHALPFAAICWFSQLGIAEAAQPRQDPAHCLALTLYWEAKSEGPDGMLAVAAVVLNRVAHPRFPDSICAVVTEGGETPPCQFSWWCDGRSDRPVEPQAWTLAQRLARSVVVAPPRDPTRGALFFHNTSISNPWLRQRERTVQIGRHIFYR